MLIVSAMGPPGGGRNPVTPRFLRHYNVIGIEAFSEEILKSVFSPLMDWHFKSFPTGLRRYSRVCGTFFFFFKVVRGTFKKLVKKGRYKKTYLNLLILVYSKVSFDLGVMIRKYFKVTLNFTLV